MSITGKGLLPGIILAGVLAALAWLAGENLPLVGAPVLGILFGMIFAFVLRKYPMMSEGVFWCSKKLLPISIVFLGFGMNLFVVAQVGSQTLFLMVFTLASTFICAYVLGKLLKVEEKSRVLIGVGTAICGGSAIAATAPIVQANEKEIAHSISTIFLFNVIAAFLFPVIGHLLHMSDHTFGLWAGTAINDTSSVVAAGYSYSDPAGDYAVIVKLTRTLMIIPITLVLSLYQRRKSASDEQGKFHLMKVLPWFIIAFAVAAAINTAFSLPGEVTGFLSSFGKFTITVAMVAIGLNTSLPALVKSGWRPLLLGLGCWVVLSVTSLFLVSVFGGA